MFNRQRGFTTWVALAIASIILAGVGAIGWNIVSSYNAALEQAKDLKNKNRLLEDDLVRLKGANDVNLLAINILKVEKEKLQEINVQRQDRAIKVVIKETKVNEKLTLVRTDNLTWANTPVPDAIIASLRDNSSETSDSNRSKGREGASTEGVSISAASSWLAGEVDELGAIDASENMATTSAYV